MGLVHTMQLPVLMDTCSTAGCFHLDNKVVPVVTILLLLHNAVIWPLQSRFLRYINLLQMSRIRFFFLQVCFYSYCVVETGDADTLLVVKMLLLTLHLSASLKCTVMHQRLGAAEIEYFGCGLCPPYSGRRSMCMINRWRTPDCQNC